jgi:hypothetical protein
MCGNFTVGTCHTPNAKQIVEKVHASSRWCVFVELLYHTHSHKSQFGLLIDTDMWNGMDRNASASHPACCRWITQCTTRTSTANQQLPHWGCRWDAEGARRVPENNKMDAANWRFSLFVCSSLRFGTRAYDPLVCRCNWNVIGTCLIGN